MARSKDKEKVETAENAKKLLELVDEWKASREQMLLAYMAKQEVGDIAPIQAEYKACLAFIAFLRAKVGDGVIAADKLRKERDL